MKYFDSLYDQDPVHYSKESDNDDATQIFVNGIEETVKKIFNKLKYTKKIIYRKQDKENFKKSTHCYVCEGELGNDKVRDHCHLSGRYRGATHHKCNLKLRKPDFIPVIFHTLEGYE